MRRYLLPLIFLMGLLTIMAAATQDGSEFVVGNFKYVVTSEATREVSVEAANKTTLSGNVTIPATVPYNDIEYTVTSIADDGFYGCGNLTGITLPATITNMGWYPFDISYNLSSISISDDNSVYSSENGILFNKDKTELMICPIGKTGDYIVPKSVNTIGNHAFFRSNLQEISLQDGITSIGTCAFSESKIRAITFPNSLQSISLYAFMHCTELSKINIPASVSDIAPGAFRDCSKLEEITVDEGNEKYVSDNGVLFNKEKSSLVQYPAVKTGKYVVPSTVTKIEDYAFGGSEGLTEIILPANLTNMGTGALSGCTKLTKIVDLNNEPQSVNYVFENVPSNVEVVVPKGSVEAYRSATGWNAFSNFTELPGEGDSFTVGDFKYTILSNAGYDVSVEAAYKTTLTGDVIIPATVTYNDIEYTVTTIADFGFNCINLTGVTLPATIIKMGWYPFDVSRNLTNIIVKEGNPVYSSEDGVLFDANKTTLIYCPLGKSGVYTVPASVKTIAANAFLNSKLEEIILQEGITSIEISAFSESKIRTITFPNSLQGIAVYAFMGCSELSKINIPASVSNIAAGAFRNCSKLEEITVEEGNEKYFSDNGVLFNKEKSSLVQYPAGKTGKYVVPSTVTKIENYAFGGSEGLTEIMLSANLITIGNSAFSNCTGLTKIVDLRIEPQTLAGNVFKDVPVEKVEVVVPKGSVQVYQSAEEWNAFTNYLELPGEGDSFTVGDLKYTILSNAGYDVSVEAADKSALTGDVTIPATVANNDIEYTVTTIPANGFDDCHQLTDIFLPSTISEIGNLVFNYSEQLKTINVDKDNSVYSSEDGVLFNKDKTRLIFCPNGRLEEYKVPSSIETIQMHAFVNSQLTKVMLPTGIKTIEPSVFTGSKIQEIILPTGLEEIGAYAFDSCKELTQIVIPASVTDIGSAPFCSCSSLLTIIVEEGNENYASEDGVLFNKSMTSLMQYPAGKVGKYTVPTTVKTIEDRAFIEAEGLTAIFLPSNLTSIRDYAFTNCSNLKSIIDKSSTPQKLGYGVFQGLPESVDVYVPKWFTNAYKQAEGWNIFDNFSEIPYLDESFTKDGLKYTIVFAPKGSTVSVEAADPEALSGVVEIPSEVEYLVFTYTVGQITQKGFSNCEKISELILPATLTNIVGLDGLRAKSLECITVAEDNPTYSSVDGVLFDKEKTTLLFCPQGKKEEYTVPVVTEVIDMKAFYESNISKVIFGENVKSIYSYAFQNSQIKDIEFPEGLVTIGYGSFMGTQLVNVGIPASVQNISGNSFNKCEKLENIIAAEENEKFSSIDGVLFNKDQTRLLVYPAGRSGEYTIPSSVTSIGSDSFSSSLGLTAVTIPSSVTEIGNWAFKDCPELRKITDLSLIPQTVGEYSFANIPEDVVLRVLKGSREKYEAAEGWKDFSNIEELPGAGDSFVVDNLKYTVTADTSLEVSVAAADKETLEGEVVIPAVIPYEGLDYTVVAVDEEGFSDCQGVTSFNIPSSIASIGTHAFNGKGVKRIEVSENNQAYSSVDGVLFDKTLTLLIYCPAAKEGEYEIPSTVIAVKEDAFENSSLTGILIPSSLEVISTTLFASADKLQSITVAEGNKVMSALDGVLFNKEKTVLLKYPNGKEGEYVIPTGVNEIGENAFSNCSGLSKLTSMSLVPPAAKESSFIDLPADAVLYVPVKAVEAYSEAEGWNKFTNVEGVYGLGDTFVMDGMLFTIISDTEVSVEKADEEFVDGYLSIPASVTKGEKDYLVTVVSDKGFYNLSGVSTINIPATIREIGAGAFAECTGVRTINVDEENEHYSSAAGILYNKDKTELVQAPGTLKEVEIAENVTSLGEYAFAGCHDLTKIINYNPEPQIATESTFVGVPEDAVVYVVAGSGEAYSKAEGWKLIGDIREIGDLKIELSATNLIMVPNSTIQLTVEVTNETLQTVVSEEWESSDANIADVSETGEITAKADGKAEISYVVTLSNGEKVSATCKVTVDTSSGVGSIDGEIDYRAPYMVFDMKGAFVGNSTENLPSGIYIIRQGEVVKKVKL